MMSPVQVGGPREKYGSYIRKEDPYKARGYTYVPVVIIGAGETGIAMGCRLKQKLGFDQFRIYDRLGGLGGTWYINRYPGVACDVPAVFYSFSFAPNYHWTTFHPEGPEIVRYLEDVCESFQIMDKIQLNTDVKECRWNEEEQMWDLTLMHLAIGMGDLSTAEREKRIQKYGRAAVYVGEERVRAKIVCSAAGGLVEPKNFPNVPGKDTFQGEIFHSARWNYDVDLKDKNVVVVGTGCSASQFVPRLTKEYSAKSVTQLMRSPPWVVPKLQPPFGHERWNALYPLLSTYVPGYNKFWRYLVVTMSEWDWLLFGTGKFSEKERKNLEVELVAHIKKTVPEKYHEILTPDYGVGCKRRIFDEVWFPGLNDPRIELTTLPLTSIQEKSVTLGPGRTYPDPKNKSSKAPTQEKTVPADVIVLANGFEVVKWLHPLEVIGRDGKRMNEVWDSYGGPTMYMSTALQGFPNFFTLFGPNSATGHSSVILASENMVEMCLKFVEPILKGEVKLQEVKKEAEIEWTTDIQRALKNTVWAKGGCNSWYKTEDTEWNSAVYPYTQINFWYRCTFPNWKDWNIQYTEKGLFRKRVRSLKKMLTFAAVLVALLWVRKQGVREAFSPRLLYERLRSSLQLALLAGSHMLQKASSKI